MASSGGDGSIEIPVIATDAASATLARIEQQLDSLTKAQQANTAATQDAVTAGTLWANVYAKAADLVLKSISAVTGAFEKSLSATIAYGDQIDGLSKRTGIAVDELQALKYAGEQAGIGFEAISGAAKRLELALAKGGTKAVNAGLKELKLSAAEAAGPGGMEKIIDSLAKISDEGERAKAATELFGRSGPQIARVAEELAKAAEEARKFGLVISADVIAAGDKTGDIMGRMAQQVEAVGIKFGGAVLSSGALQAALEVLSEIVADVSKFFDENGATITSWVNTAIILAADAIAKYLVPTITGLIDTLQFMGIGVSAAVTAFKLLVIEATTLGKALFVLASGRPGDAIKAVKDGAAAAQAELANFKKGVDETVASNSKMHDAAAKVQAALDGYAKKIAEGGDANVKAKAQTDQHREAIEGLSKEAQEAAKKLKELQDSLSDEGIAAAQAKALSDLEEIISNMGGSAKLSRDEIERFAKKMLEVGPAGKAAAEGLREVLFETGQIQKLASSGLRFDTLIKTDGLSKAATELAGKFSDADTAAKKTQATLKELFDAGIIDATKYNEELKKAGGTVIELGGKTDDTKKQTDDFAKAMQLAANVMQVLGIDTDSVTGKLFGFANVLGSLSKGEGGKFSFGALKANLKTVDGQMAAIAAGAQVLDAIGKKLGKDTKAGGALSGAAKGAQIGSVLGPYGAAVGAVVGGVLGFLKGAKLQKQAKEAGAALGVKVSTELGKKIAEDAKKLKIDFKDAALLHIGDAIAESGKSARTFGPQIIDLINKIEDGSIPAAEGMAALAENFDAVTEAAKKSGIVGDAATRAIISQAKATGNLTDNMKEFQKTNVQLAASGVGKAFPNLTAVTEEQGKAQGVIFSASFFAAVAEFGLVEGADMFRKSFEGLNQSLTDTFGAEFASSVLGPIKEILDLTAEGSGFRAAAEGADGLKDALTGIANAGYLTQDAFNAFGVAAQGAYDQAIAAGATQRQGIEAILPLLQAQVSAAEQYGFTLDSNTQALVDQAKTEGFTFPTDPLLQVVDLLGAIATKLGADIPDSFNKMGASAEQAAQRTTTAVSATASGVSAAVAQTAASTQASIASTAAAASASVASVSAQGVMSAESLASAASSSAAAVEASFSAAFGVVATTSEMATDEAVASMTAIATEGEAAANSLDLSKALQEIMAVKAAALDAKAAVGGIGGPKGGGGGGSDQEVPKFAEGGYIPPRPGGTRIIVGEKGEGEYVVPQSQMGQQPITVTYQVQVDANGLDKAGAVAAIQEALKNADRGLLLQLQKANTGRR